jgi:hypothetical protein
MLRVGTNDAHDAIPMDDLALVADGLYGRSNFHDCLSSQKTLSPGSENLDDAASRFVVRSQLYQNLVVQPEPDEIHLRGSRRVPNHLSTIHFQLQPERDVRQ